MPNIKAHMICHTHWDREWYLTREQFKTKLVRLIDNVLEVVENCPDYVSFMLDGQVIAVEDYLEIRPQNKERLVNAISSGKICVGPWYVLPDEVLISGESHIRNYLIGQKIASEFGGKMKVGYLPDSFGHPEQMPQILQGLSMDTIVFWRGTGNHMTNSEFYWQSPYKKSRILGVHMPYGYGNSARLSAKLEESVPRLKGMMDNLKLRSTSNIVLLMNGSDHILNQNNIVDIVRDFNEQAGEGKHIELSTMQHFLDELKPTLSDLATYTGELRYGDRSMLLGGTLSTRMYLKQNNTEVQRNMERYLEPMVTVQKLLGIKNDFKGYQDYLWKKILENHPHDSICGCSVDEVHAEMMTRFDCVKQLEHTLMSDTVSSIAEKKSTSENCDKVQLIHFEPTQDSLPTYHEVFVDFDPMLVKRVNYSRSNIDEYEHLINHPDAPAAVKVYDQNGREIKAKVLSGEKNYYMHLQDETAPEVYKVNRCKLGLLLPAFDYGFSTLTVEKCQADAESAVVRNNRIENEFYTVEFDCSTATFTVTDKITGRVHTGVNRLIDKGDAGDEYTYSWPQNDTQYTMNADSIEMVSYNTNGMAQSLTIKGKLLLPSELSADRSYRSPELIENPVIITATLYSSVNRIDFQVELDNQSNDHILQVEIPSGVLAKESWSSTAVAVTKHDIEVKMPETWVEYPFPNHPTHGFVDINNGQYGVSIACDGITEYQADNCDGVSYLRLTLLRCVGWLSRADLLTREGNGGWSLETPDAQCIGKQSFHYSVIYHEGTWQQANTYAAADRALHKPYVEQIVIADKRIALEQSIAGFLSQLPGDIRLSAFKLSERGTEAILRVFSISQDSKTVSLTLPASVKQVYRCNLNETDLGTADFTDSTLSFEIDFGEICTFKLLF